MNQQPDSDPRQARMAAQSNLRYTATLVRDSNDAIIVQDFTGRISTWNHQAELMYGYSEAEALQMTSWCLVPPGKVAGLEEIVRRLMAGEWIASFATQRMAKDGRILDVWLTVTKLVDSDGRPIGIASTGRDLTAGKLVSDLQLASELRYRRLFETAEDGILILDAVTGLIVYVNPFLIDLLGYSRAVFLGKKLWEVGLFKDIAANQAKFAELQQHEHIRYENLPLETSDGRQIEVEFVSTVYEVNGGKVIQCNIRDITLRKRMEAALQGSENKYRDLFQGSRDALMTIEPPLGMITAGNQAALQIFGVKNEADFISLAPGDLSPDRQPDGRASAEKAQEMIATALREGSHFFEWTHRRLDGGEFQADVLLTKMERDGKVVVQATIRDITEHQQAEAAMRLQSSALNASANAIVIADQKGNVVWANPAFTKLTGYEVSEILGKNPLVLKSGQHDTAFYRQMWEALTTGQVWSGEIVNKHKDGHLYTEEMTITPVRDDRGEIANFIAVKQDITARKRMEEELRQSQRQVVEQEKLRVLGQMASGIAHDFNNALAPIIGFSELLLKHPEKVADQQLVVKYLQHINTCGTDAARVVRQMREFSRQRATVEDYRPLDINKLVRQTIEHTQQRWKDQAQATGRTIQIVTDLLPMQQITGEESAIRELLTNLIFNAVDALPAGGTITLGTMLDGQWVRLSVSDTGTGMTEEVRRRCLEPFFTTKGAEGTGLGLAMVQGIVQRHNGTLDIESQVGQGTTFIIRFSLQHGTPSPVPLKVPALPQSLHVLVVDDEPLLRTVAEAWLVEDGHTVETAESGAAALARPTTGKFDLVITDKAMPNMNGEQLAAAIYKGETIAPVILMTGFGDLMKVAGELPPHISAILSKPITQESLREALAKVFPGK